MPVATPISRSRFELAECVLWDERLRLLWWTDIHAATLWQYDIDAQTERSWSLPDKLGCFALTQTDHVLLLGLAQRLVRFNTLSGEITHLQNVEPHLPQTRINDGRCDPAGNFVFGTRNDAGMHAIGSYYRYTPDGTLNQLDIGHCAIANSICFSHCDTTGHCTMYFCDSPTKKIMACDYDPENGNTRHARMFAALGNQFAPDPDGSIVDDDGFLWNAEWRVDQAHSCVTRYAPDGRVDRRIDVAASQVSCLTFGTARTAHAAEQDEFDTLYITTAHTGLGTAALAAEPDAGAIFTCRLAGIRGRAETRFGGS